MAVKRKSDESGLGGPIVSQSTEKPEKQKPAPKMTATEYHQATTTNLINKAFLAFIISVAALVIVFIVTFFFDGNDEYTSYIIGVLTTIVTISLGFLFGTSIRK